MEVRQSRQIVLLFMLPALLSVALLAWFLRSELEGWAVARWSEDHREFAQLLGEQIDNDLANASNLLQYTATLPEFSRAPDSALIDRSLNGIPPGTDIAKRNTLDQLIHSGGFSVIFLLTPEGDHYLSHPYSVQQRLKKYNLADRSYFREATQTKQRVISDTFTGADGVRAVAINVPILDASGSIIAHLGGVHHLSALSDMIAPTRIAPFTHAALFDRNGQQIAASSRDTAQATGLAQPQQGASHPGQIGIDRTQSADGTQWLRFHIPFHSGWSLVLTKRMDDLLGDISPQLKKTITLGMAILLLTSLFGALVARLFSQRWQRAEKALKRANETLEERIRQRTEALTRSEIRHRTLFESTADAVLLMREGRIVDCNPAALGMFGASDKKTIMGYAITELSANHQQTFDHTLLPADPDCHRFEWSYKRLGSDEVLDAEVQLSGMVLDGSPILQATIRDISARKQAESRIRTLSQAIAQSPVSVVITDTDGNIEYVNQAFETITGYSEEESLGRNSRFLKSGKTPPRRYRELWRALSAGESWKGEFQNKRKNGEVFWEQAYIAPVLDELGVTQHYLAVKQDITVHKLQEEHILHQALYDNLTDLPNRLLSLDRLETMINESKRHCCRVAVLFIDLDDFKKVNDSLGHETGDELLLQAGTRLKQAIRNEDTVGRLGGDEFIVLLSNLTDAEDALPVARKILQEMRLPFRIAQRDLVVTASIGIALYPDNGSAPPELLRNADTAMYASKAGGRNTIHFFTPEMNQGVSRRLLLEEQLRGALSNNELNVLFQPLIDLRDSSIIGAEALLRWQNPTLGAVPPDEFIPVAEQTGMIVPIGEFVLSEAIRMAEQWTSRFNPAFKVAVNVSPRQFRDEGLVEFIRDKLSHSKLNGQCLELEITEGVLMDNHSYINNALAELCRMNIGIAMDDFGTGYSSLSYLRSYPFDILKIDRSFINDITVDPADRELVNAAIAMAHGLGLKVVAEGVETEMQHRYLSAQRCDFAQGYLFSKPISAQALTQQLQASAEAVGKS